MIYKFNNEVENQIIFYENNFDKIYHYNAYNHSLLYTKPPNSSNVIFRYQHEIITDKTKELELFRVIDKIKSEDNPVYLSTSTITPSKYQFHPLVNIHIQWCGFRQRTYVHGKWEYQEDGFSGTDYDYTKKLEFDKTHKSILSVRKETYYRNYFLNNITPDELGIFRYIAYTTSPEDETEKDYIYSEQLPTWKELHAEYKKSIFSFIVETDISYEEQDCQISEKTLLAFMTGTVPIVLGARHMVKLLKDIGFYVWNDEYGYTTADNSNDRFIRADKFVECYNTIKKLSFEESKVIWLYNQDKIQQNYDIASNLLMRKKNGN